jgi:hypothetical protein
VPDRGHSAKKRNKPPAENLSPSFSHLTLSPHPPSARRRRLAAVPSAHRRARASPRPCRPPATPTHSHARRARRHHRRARRARARARAAVPLTRARCARRARARRARRARARARAAVPLTRARVVVPLVVPLATAARPRVPSSPPREVYTFYASIHHVVVDLPSYSHLHHEAL